MKQISTDFEALLYPYDNAIVCEPQITSIWHSPHDLEITALIMSYPCTKFLSGSAYMDGSVISLKYFFVLPKLIPGCENIWRLTYHLKDMRKCRPYQIKFEGVEDDNSR